MIDYAHLQLQLAPTLAALEEERVRQHARVQTAMLACIGVGGLVSLALAPILGELTVWMLAPLAVAFSVYGWVYSGARKGYARGFKSLVMPEIVKQFGELQYNGLMGLSEDEFNLPRLYESPTRFESEDLVEGTLGATHLRFCECHAERRETRTNSNGGSTTQYVTYFRGLFFIADFNKQFHGVTAILPEGWGMGGPFGQKLQALGGKLSGAR
jgi:hypothetical protein